MPSEARRLASRSRLAAKLGEDKLNCDVCISRDRGTIESLLAHGVFVKDIAFNYGYSEIQLRRHDALHSTRIPSVDPEAILRQMRWLNEEAFLLAQTQTAFRSTKNKKEAGQEPGGTDKEGTATTELGGVVHANKFDRKAAAISLSLKVLSELASMVNVKKHIDPYIVQPRWENIMKRLAHRLRDNPAALKTLRNWMKEEGPPETEEEARAREQALDAQRFSTITADEHIPIPADGLDKDPLDIEAYERMIKLEKENAALKERAEKMKDMVVLQPKDRNNDKADSVVVIPSDNTADSANPIITPQTPPGG